MEPATDTRSSLDMFGSQSTLEPGGLGADLALNLTPWMTVGFGAVFIGVTGLIVLARRRNRPAGHWWVWSGGIVLPIVAIAILMAGSTVTLIADSLADEEALVVDVTGEQFWWDVVYDADGMALRDANELVLPAGRAVTLGLQSVDVIHSFWVPSLSGKMDMIPGRVHTLTICPDTPGRYRGQCADFCGLSHPGMAFEVVAMEPAAFELWLAETAGEAGEAATPQRLAAREVFIDSGCPACHEIRGVAEGGRLGPDLTRVGACATFGAGMWQMNQGNTAGWIADVCDMKPGAEMPGYNHLRRPELRAVSAYLMSLK